MRLEAKHAELADKENERALREANNAVLEWKAKEAEARKVTETMREKSAIAQNAADCLEAKCKDLLDRNRILLDAATGSLDLLKKGAPGWGRAKDILNWAIQFKAA